jgi:uncharacterized protein YijF (DUF1287 family)
MRNLVVVISVVVILIGMGTYLADDGTPPAPTTRPFPALEPPDPAESVGALRNDSPAERIADAAAAQIGVTKTYDPAYVSLDYPGGDVDPSTGVCTDVVVRALRGIDVDLQRRVHEDMTAAHSDYPNNWNLRRPDPNIDHRRVPNLMRYFERQDKSRPITDAPDDYLPGDIVVWKLPSGLLHCGIVDAAPVVIHNIGRGTQRSADLFSWKQVGHYRW